MKEIRIISMISVAAISIGRTGVNYCISSYYCITVVVDGNISASVNISVSCIAAYVCVSVI